MRSIQRWILGSSLFLFACSTPVPLKSRGPASETWTDQIEVVGGDEASFIGKPSDHPIDEERPCSGHPCDVVVVGGGLAGLSSAFYLTQHGKRVIILEKEAQMGGLASANTRGVRYDRGAAYWTDAYPEEKHILNDIGLKDFHVQDQIPEPIDTYFWKGKLYGADPYKGIWDLKALDELPISFKVFWFELQQADNDGKVPNQPIEEAKDLELDKYTAEEWINLMPSRMEGHLDKLQKMISENPKKREKKSATGLTLRQQLKIGRLILDEYVRQQRPGMKDVIGLMDLYCRSALGGNARDVSAVAFANFYISEIVPRYTTPMGTGQAAINMIKILKNDRKDESGKRLATLKTRAVVAKITNTPESAEVTYIQGGETYRIHAPYVVFSAQLGLAPTIITGFKERSPEQAELMSQLNYAHYAVHSVYTKGHPYRASYDTWVRSSDYTDTDFTDVILGRWMEEGLKGYEGYRDFSKNPKQRIGIYTIYHALPAQPLGTKYDFNSYDDAEAKGLAKKAALRMDELFSTLPSHLWHGPMEITRVITNRWSFSVHLARPGHYTNKARILRQPFERVFFGNNNIGTPAFEEALFRGHCAANNVLKRLFIKFKNESWSKCPLD